MAEQTLWNYAVDFYGRPGIAPLCIAWQDKHGVDVTVLLFAIWAASQGRGLQISEIRAAAESVANWRQEVIEPLRHMRRQLKQSPYPDHAAGVSKVRELVKAAELQSEQVSLGVLEGHLPQQNMLVLFSIAEIAVKNVTNVLKYFDVTLEKNDPGIQTITSAILAGQNSAA